MISNHLHDCRARESLRAEMAAQTERWLAERGLAEPPQAPGFERFAVLEPLTMRQRITADTQKQEQAKGWQVMNKPGKPSCYEKNGARFRILPTKPDAKHEITGEHLRQAFRKLGVTGGRVAAAFGKSPPWMTRVIKHETGDADFRRQVLKKAWELAEVVK